MNLEAIQRSVLYSVWILSSAHRSCEPMPQGNPLAFCKLLFTKKQTTCSLNPALVFVKPERVKPEREY